MVEIVGGSESLIAFAVVNRKERESITYKLACINNIFASRSVAVGNVNNGAAFSRTKVYSQPHINDPIFSIYNLKLSCSNTPALPLTLALNNELIACPSEICPALRA